MPFHFKPILLFGTLLLGFTACERTQRTETDTRATNTDSVSVTRTETTTRPNDELREFRDWVNNKTAEADTNASRRWPKVKDEFKTRSSKLETRLDSLSDESKREYAELKKRYELWEKKQEVRTSQPLNETTLAKWQKDLLGDRQDLNTVTPGNARETYLMFMGVVRAKKANWTLTDWDYVDHVYSQLNNRKSQIESKISMADRLKIKSLQAEYLALEAGADAQDAYQHVKD